VIIDPRARIIWLSRIFQWYAPDYGAAPLALGNRRLLLDFIAPHLDSEVSRAMATTSGWPMRFRRYDWRLNA
jgi:hypothetical protein